MAANAVTLSAPAVATSLRRCSARLRLSVPQTYSSAALSASQSHRGEGGVTHDRIDRHRQADRRSRRVGIRCRHNSQGAARSRPTRRELSTMRVLIVEDDDAIADAARQGPRARGPRRSTGSRPGPTRSTAARPATFDVVLLDLGLPDRDGFDVCRELRARSDVPIIVVTARSRGGRPGGRARARRRRLHREAVRLPRAGRAHPRRRASSHSARRPPRRRTSAATATGTAATSTRPSSRSGRSRSTGARGGSPSTATWSR